MAEQAKAEVKEINTFFTSNIHCRCPVCDEEVDGWMIDPAGAIEECEYCGAKLHVSNNYEIKFV